MSLEALERSDLSRLPGGIFTRAFIRAYAQEVGLDPDRTIQDFIAELPPDAATGDRAFRGVEDGEKLESDRRAVATAMRLVLVSLPIIGLVVYYGGTQRMPAGSAAAIRQSQSHSPGREPRTRGRRRCGRQPAASTVRAGAPRAASSGLTMEIAPRAACWVSVTVDGDRRFRG